LARLASPDTGAACRSSPSDLPERPSLGPACTGTVACRRPPDESGFRLFRCRMGIRRGNHGASCLISPCSRRAVALHRSRIGIAYRCGFGLPRRPCLARFIATGVGQPPFGGMPWHVVSLPRTRRGTSWSTGDAWLPASWRPASQSCPHLACPLSKAAWRKAALHRCRVRERTGRRPASGWDPLGSAGCVVARQTRFSAVVFLEAYAPRRSDRGSASPRVGPPPQPFGCRLHQTDPLHGSRVPRIASPRRRLSSSSRTAFCFTERRHQCGAHTTGDRPARSPSIRPAARRSAPRPCLQRTGRSRRAARNR
jgi:hypothetical protein